MIKTRIFKTLLLFFFFVYLFPNTSSPVVFRNTEDPFIQLETVVSGNENTVVQTGKDDAVAQLEFGDLQSPVLVSVGDLSGNLEIISCEDCSTDLINDSLGSPKEEGWVVVSDSFHDGTTVLYTHSSTQPWGITFGQVFLDLENNNTLKDSIVCFEDMCYSVAEVVSLDREDKRLGQDLVLENIFKTMYKGQVIIVTCSDYIVPWAQTPKLLIQLQPY